MQRSLITLSLALALALPALAQQPTTTPPPDQKPDATAPQQAAPAQDTSATQTTTPSQTDNTASPLPPPGQPPAKLEMRKEGFWGRINPFARKKYVQRQVSPIRDTLNELDDLTAANAKAIRDVDSRAQAGIQVASAKANEADMHAQDAHQRAVQAGQTAEAASTRLTTVQKVVSNLDQYRAESEMEIRFRPGQTALSKKSKDALDDLATPLKGRKGYVIEVQAFSSGRGQAALANSQQLADSVVRYLVLNHEIPLYRIYTVGMGNAPMPAREDGAKPRRSAGGTVQIALLKNDAESLETEPIPVPPSAAPTGAAPSSQPSSQPTSTPPPAAAQPPAQTDSPK